MLPQLDYRGEFSWEEITKITDEAHFLYKGRFIASGTLDEIRDTDDPTLEEFFYGTEEYGA